MTTRIDLTEVQKQLFVSMSSEGQSVPMISKVLGISCDVLWRVAKDLELNLKSKKMYQNRNRKYDYSKWNYKDQGQKRLDSFEKVVSLMESRVDEILVSKQEFKLLYRGEELTQIPFKCSSGTVNRSQTWSQYKQAKGCSCSSCLGKRISLSSSQSRRKSFTDMKQYCLSKEYTLDLDEEQYSQLHNTEFVPVVCSNSHRTYKNISNLVSGCSECNIKSYGEIELCEFIESIVPEVTIFRNVRNVISPLELDIYLPELHLAIEYCGLYWHSERYLSEKYHNNKYQECKDKGISLLTIFENEWQTKQEIVKSRIKSYLQKNTKVFGASRCKIQKVDYQESKKFFQQNHLQGDNPTSLVIYGLYLEGQLVSAMSFSKSNISKGGSGECWELLRFANKLDTHIVGGGSRLFKIFLEQNYPQKVISYCDLKWGDRGLYTKLGFTYDGFTGVNYYYHDQKRPGKLIHRFSCRKDQLYKRCKELQLEVKDYKDESERSLASKLNLVRVYDCGHNRYIWLNNGKN